MKNILISLAFTVALTGCVATAPVSISWRSNSTQQHSTTEGKNTKEADKNTVNADKMMETQAAVSTSSGTANTAEQGMGQKGEEEEKKK